MFRRHTHIISVGHLQIGNDCPIRIQSMTNTPTQDIAATLQQIRRLYEAQCEIVRIAVPNFRAIEAFRSIKSALQNDKIYIPLVADVHFSPSIAIACLPFADKIRINPGNFHNYYDTFKTLIRSAKKEGKAIRIGVNRGSLSKSILEQYDNTSEGVYQSALPFLEIAQEEDFYNIILSFKSSDVNQMIDDHRYILRKLDTRGLNFPIHLGVTEVGNDTYGRIKSAIGIGSLLLEGIGDTIRVSLTEDPVHEISVAYDILQACNKRINHVEYIACPSCGRTQFNIEHIFNEIKEKTAHLRGIKIAVMGCLVNGIGEMGDADFGYIGAGPGRVNLYHKNRCIKTNILEENAVAELLHLIEISLSIK
ncbi:MAG: (E)-4-hydroxy-3-methylbut-2-enyl-diphosphate synthase [Puniceicoccales bacterium]|jgi:(E)-4-hydroxy-3-methylbut-2-enyl-diphosphate synthase|nr:(E)-4-hydroxy-3-methylbut-2-enyl-diphosphate synthase [Puniceicoccales bacterium]